MSADKPNRGKNPQSRSDFRRLSRRFMSGLLRSLFFINSSTRYSRAGFVLPTTVLLLLVMTLTVGAMSFRSFSRTQSASIAREQEVIDNIAAPAVDRAKAKLEYLFTRDTRLPGTGTPPSDVLATLMLNIDSIGAGGLGITKLGKDPYTLPGERRLNINGTTNGNAVDNAWSFDFDLNGDGTTQPGETIAYSILMDDAVDTAGTPNKRDDDIKLEDTGTAANILKAKNLVTRNGPINTAASLSNCGGSREPQQGWLAVNAANLEKNFQITAYASNDKKMGRANSALELQQVRRALQGNRWGAWFKYDMEIHPGPEFNWNGAIHTDGNMLVTNKVRAHMISSHNSCLYTQSSSAITMAQNDYNGGGIKISDGDFQGQLFAGAPSYGKWDTSDTPRLHIFTTLGAKPQIDNDSTKLTKANDSVDGESYDDLKNVALDPVELFAKNVSRHRGTGWKRATDWATSAYSTGGRVINQSLTPPYLDDFYRADNRYGPRPSYDKANWVTKTDDGAVNTTRSSASYDIKIGDEILPTDDGGDNLMNLAAGLDGYWERQAIGKGMRVVVGQRLELGNHLGWNFNAGGSTKDPLYPSDLNGMKNKQKQRITLRDNLAAVQGMVVYHYEKNNGNFPLACIANTAHSGTIETLRTSRTFSNYPITGTLKTNFLEGEGTNGWEFSFPSDFDTEAKFGAELAKTKPLGVALRNLAYFAGDPKGGSPSFTPVQEAGVVHPFPQQAMWGDYSVLRRIFDDQLDNAIGWRSLSNPPSLASTADRYGALSPADKSSLHSAACTLGMLAYNLSSQQAADKAFLLNYIPNQGMANTLGSVLIDAIGASGSGPTGSAAAACTSVVNPLYDYDCTSLQIDKEAVLSSLSNVPNRQTAVRLIGSLEQIKRDRTYGFRAPSSTSSVDYVGKRGSKKYLFRFSAECSPDDPNSAIAELFEGVGNGLTDSKAALALMCAPAAPKYPSLYYLFPKVSHDQVGTGLYAQPTTEEYINQPYLTNATSGANRVGKAAYKVVGDNGSIPDVEDSSDSGISAVSFEPRLVNLSNWSLPRGPVGANATLNPETMNIKLPNNKLQPLSLLEKVTYNGREEMAVRLLDIDLGLLTQKKTGGSSGDYWISDGQDTSSGIFYTAREDALREDAIVRPASVAGGSTTTWANCKTLTNLLTTSKCRMDATRAVSGGPTDPPLTLRGDGSRVGISVKPVDFAPDPDRRPYGFRLNANLDGNKGDLSNKNARTWGFTFVTDNAAYLKGQFNPHTSNGTDTLEEFTQTLFNGSVGFGTPFYDNRTTLNTSIFATKTSDRWRVAEILADSVSLVSNNFVDGAIQEGFIRNRDEVSTDFKNTANSNSRTSFHNQQRPLDDDGNAWGGVSDWLRIDGSYTNAALPIWIGNNGESKTAGKLFNDATKNADFILPDERSIDSLIVADTPERINATIISGLVPSRNKQGYGGLHNFPRFMENWEEKNLFIQGAFLQLNFSTTGTAPWDADAWQPGETTDDKELINYYKPPARRWGYDVGLQYSPAGPIAQRFVQVDRPRSEHYRELSVEDPYVTNLRCSEMIGNAAGVGTTRTRRFPNESCS